jgi:hypothetical protein
VSLVYYALVIEEKDKLRKGAKARRGRSQDADDLAAEFRHWWKEGRRFVVRDWDTTAFQQEVGELQCRETDRQFLSRIVELASSATSADALFVSSESRALVKAREATVRKGKCRLCGRPEHRRYLMQWEAPPKRSDTAFQLSFRHNTGDTIVRDLLRQPHKRSIDVQD